MIEKKDTYTLISATENTITKFHATFLKEADSIKKEHIIVDLSLLKGLKKEDFLLFLDISYQKKNNGTSFALVSKEANADDFEDDFNVVPTLIEAEDILEMEAIERELGF